MKKKVITGFILFLLILFNFSLLVRGNNNFVLIYVVQQGDTIYDIARDYNISMQKLLEVNNIENSIRMRPGRELIIPLDNKNIEEEQNLSFEPSLFNNKQNGYYSFDTNNTYAIRVNSEQVIPDVDHISEDEIVEYHVSRGDSLYELARSFNTTTGIIMALNDMDNNIIRYGQTIKLPVNNLSSRQVIARTITDEEIDLLARAIYGEARGEPFMGQIAVGAVIINRMVSSQFPDTFQGVIYQPGQFCVVNDGQIYLTPNQTAFDAAREALNGVDPTQGSLYYYNPRTATNSHWIETNRNAVVTIGAHVFFD